MNRHPIGGELHAELGNDQQHTRTPGTADERHQGHHHTNFARNLSRSLFKMRQKRCNSNDASSIFERDKGELRAKLLSIPHAPTKKRAATHGHSKQPSPHMLKSLYKTNTFCPPSKLAPNNFEPDFLAPQSRKVGLRPTLFGVIGHYVLLELVPGVVVGGGVVEFVEADCVAPAGDGAGGLVGLTGVLPGIFEGCVGGHGRQDPRCWLRVS